MQSAQFLKNETTIEDMILKIDEKLNKLLLAMNKKYNK